MKYDIFVNKNSLLFVEFTLCDHKISKLQWKLFIVDIKGMIVCVLC